MSSSHRQSHELSITSLLQYHELLEKLEGETSSGFLKSYRTQLQTLSSQLQPEVLARYHRACQRFGGNGGHPVVAVSNGACWCGCKLPAYQHFLLRSQTMTCQNCGRLLVRSLEGVG
jgi:predicted  nucleic acid-binding Zn-ribbon protein